MKNNIENFAKKDVKEVLETIKAEKGNSFISINEDLASTENLIAIKDIHNNKGSVVTVGSKMLENYIAPYESEVTRLLKEEGYNIAGHTNLDEFAMGATNKTSYFGPVDNAFDPTHVSGGSSGGSAYAVAKGLVPVATATDTGGSVRQPAAFNGVYGLKPTYGVISRYGTIPFASSFDTVGVIANTIEDTAKVLKTLAKNDEKDQTNFVPENYVVDDLIGKDVKGMKACYIKEWLEDDYNQEIKDALIAQRDRLVEMGVEVEEISMPLTSYSVELYILLAYSEASSNLNRFDGIRFGNMSAEDAVNAYSDARNAFGTEVKKRLIIGTYVISSGNSKQYHAHAQRIRQRISDQMNEALEKYDFIVGPTTPNLAFAKDYKMDAKETYLSDKFAIPANLSGVPSLSVPIGNSKDGYPIGMQIMAAKYKENKIFQLAKALEGGSND